MHQQKRIKILIISPPYCNILLYSSTSSIGALCCQQKNLEASIIQNLLSVIVHSDKDNDFQIDPNEVPTLVLKLQNLNGVTFNEANFRKAMKSSGYSLRAVLEITKNLLDDKIPEKDNIFVVKTERLLPKSLKKEQNLVNE